MEEQVARFIAPGPKLPLPPPASEASFFGWTRKNLFATPMDSVLTILGLVFIVWAGWNLIGWGITRAVFEGNDRTACLGQEEGDVGACWAFVKARFGQFVYGLYPTGERWRVDVIFALLAALLIPVAIPTIPYKRLNAILLLGVFPFVALVLLTGGEFDLSGGATALILTLTAIATLFLAGSRIDLGWESPWLRAAAVLVLLALAALIFSGDGGRGPTLLGIRFTTTSLLAFGAAALAIVAAAFAAATRIAGAGRGEALRTVLIPVAAFVAVLVALNADFGLPPVRTSLWGGLLVTLVVALSGIAASLPLGILLALGRRSEMPAIRLLCIIFIEFWRGVPLITVLFMANFMLPLLLPAGVSFDQLLRALVGVALFSAAYMAEVIRGGLQAIPKGQYEGADAMGLAYWQKMRMIILPQALKLVIPGIVNTFIGLFKDTSLVYIIGLADLLGTVRRGFSDPNWITPSTPATGLVFAAFVFWLFCFGMSRYSIFMERRLDTAQKH